jgi:hypothetical protein
MVTTKGGILVNAITKPFKNPMATPDRQDKPIAVSMGRWFIDIKLAHITPDKATVDPQDKSIPDIRMVNMTPIDK